MPRGFEGDAWFVPDTNVEVGGHHRWTLKKGERYTLEPISAGQGSFKDAYVLRKPRGGGDTTAVLVFREGDGDSTPEGLRNKELENLQKGKEKGCEYLPVPYGVGRFYSSREANVAYPALLEEYINWHTLDESFIGGELNNALPGGEASDLKAAAAARCGSLLLMAVGSIHETVKAPHRDIKPNNAKYEVENGLPLNVRIIDWGTVGIDRGGDTDATRTTSGPWTAPERHSGSDGWLYEKEIEEESYRYGTGLDVYSAGTIMAWLRTYHLLEHVVDHGVDIPRQYKKTFRAMVCTEAGDRTQPRRPFDLARLLDALSRLTDDEGKPLCDPPTEDDLALSEVIMACTQPHPSERATVEEALGMLGEILGGDVVVGGRSGAANSGVGKTEPASGRELLPGADGTEPPAAVNHMEPRAHENKTVPIGANEAPSQLPDRYTLWLVEYGGNDPYDLLSRADGILGGKVLDGKGIEDPVTRTIWHANLSCLPTRICAGASLDEATRAVRELQALGGAVVAIGIPEKGGTVQRFAITHDQRTGQAVLCQLSGQAGSPAPASPRFLVKTGPSRYRQVDVLDNSEEEVAAALMGNLRRLIEAVAREEERMEARNPIKSIEDFRAYASGEELPSQREAPRPNVREGNGHEELKDITVICADGKTRHAEVLLCFESELTGETYLIYEFDESPDADGGTALHASTVVEEGGRYRLEAVSDEYWPLVQEVMRDAIRCESDEGDKPRFRYGAKDDNGDEWL